jgi:hypothetical protein
MPPSQPADVSTMIQPDDTITRLNLLTDEGPVAVMFTPALESSHYSELFQLSHQFTSKAALQEIVSAIAEDWGRQVVFG